MFDGTGEKFDEFSKSSASCQTKTIQIIVIIVFKTKILNLKRSRD